MGKNSYLKGGWKSIYIWRGQKFDCYFILSHTVAI